jgi:hypothetical protein
LLTFFISTYVTINIYFPAATIERAADQIVKETWGGPRTSNSAPAAEPQFILATRIASVSSPPSERTGSRY